MAINSEWIDNDEQLAIECASWSQQTAIAIDTEFMRSDTFFPHIGLLQIADSNGAYLIDPLSIENKSLLVDVFKQPSVTKVIHSCSQDLNVFHHYLNTLPKPIFDTQVAAVEFLHDLEGCLLVEFFLARAAAGKAKIHLVREGLVLFLPFFLEVIEAFLLGRI